MNISLIADDSVSSAPAGFTAAVQAAAQVFDQDIPGDYTVNITYGWGTYSNKPDTELTPSNPKIFSVGGYDTGNSFSYNYVRNLVTTAAMTSEQVAAAATLPTVSPYPGDSFVLSSAQEKALGVFTGSAGAVDGSIGLNTDDVQAGVLSSFAKEGALVEIAHALGLFSGSASDGSAYVLDLFRYASSSVRYADNKNPDYLSIDNGVTDLANYDTSGFDPTLFTGLAHDPFSLGSIDDGNQATLSGLDLEALNLMGFRGTTNLFGSITNDATSQAGQIYALYQTILGRAADSAGLEHFTEQAANGTAITTIAQDMLTSAEYANDYGSSVQTKKEFVTQLYVDGLHRGPDAGGLAAYKNALAGGLSRAQAATDIATSAESQNDLAPVFQNGLVVPNPSDVAIAQLYYGLLDRAPDAVGLANNEMHESQGASLSDIASAFLTSPEYAARYAAPTNSQFVTALYQAGLGRQPDAGGAGYYTGQLDGGASRTSIALDIVESPEANAHLAPLIQGELHLA